jgi:hypothetical protein
MDINSLKGIKKFTKGLHPVTAAFFDYLSYILTGWLLLSLPLMQDNKVSSLDNLFTAASAVSTTGLAHGKCAWNLFIFRRINHIAADSAWRNRLYDAQFVCHSFQKKRTFA